MNHDSRESPGRRFRKTRSARLEPRHRHANVVARGPRADRSQVTRIRSPGRGSRPLPLHIAEGTKTSLPPASVRTPKAFEGLKHFTLPL